MDRWLIRLLFENRNYRFWFCQFVGWAGYSLVTFLSITLVDDNVSWPHTAHISLTAVLGILTSWPLRPLFRFTFDLPVYQRILIAIVAVLVFSGIWTVLRVVIFAWFLGEEAIWNEFNYWYFGSLFVFLSWTVLYYGISYYELLSLEHQKLLETSAAKNQEKLKRLQAETMARQARLQMLRYQLNPHFLFNTLNAISSLVQLSENAKAQKMIELLSGFLRHSLEQDGVENVSLREELEYLNLYLDIEKARFEDRLVLEFDIDPLSREASVPVLILQPIIENAMKYAIDESENGGTVRVSARLVREHLLLEISDTGPGIGDADILDQRGIGLSNTMKRLETLYQNQYSFDLLDRHGQGLTVRLRIPFKRAIQEREHAGAHEDSVLCES